MKEEKGMEFKTTQLSFTNTTSNSTTMPTTSTTKRLLFDRRYGWVIDEWKNPSEEALAGGRGMFCIVPIAKGLLEMASNSISVVANSAIEILERRDRFCPQQLQATVSNQLQQLAASIQKPGLTLLKFKSKHAGNGDLQELETA
ncbi:uncharacterized protein LOC110725664 [Chenopodium quinoa]|uniref:uncharacterized protein LOC110725664 n=1 Tax=Chenopodium quinoa TaxID=63459 RepID=UPI000B78C923|nr:uncharacterized protein LOC110725664 [Chenopodium quinoa]